MTKIFAHGSYIGNTGYNNHTREFFRHLSKHAEIKFRNFTVGSGWNGMNEEPHNDEYYFNDTDRNYCINKFYGIQIRQEVTIKCIKTHQKSLLLRLILFYVRQTITYFMITILVLKLLIMFGNQHYNQNIILIN